MALDYRILWTWDNCVYWDRTFFSRERGSGAENRRRIYFLRDYKRMVDFSACLGITGPLYPPFGDQWRQHFRRGVPTNPPNEVNYLAFSWFSQDSDLDMDPFYAQVLEQFLWDSEYTQRTEI